MPMSTIELPRSMVDAVHEYAERERVSVLDLFASMLKKQYGYVMTVKIDKPQRRVSARDMIGFGRRKYGETRTTSEIMRELREGED